MSQISIAGEKNRALPGLWPLSGAALAAIVFLGLALRVFFAAGPLWNDEIWSILNLRGVSGPTAILWGLSHDNNHFLNSIWLFLVLPLTSDPTALRLLSILAGTLTIVAMGRLGSRHGTAAGLVAAGLTAFSFFQVVYSVEARGYAVATAALVLAWGEIERAPERRSSVRLALACGLGFFAHLAFGPALACLAFAHFAENIRLQKGGAPAALAETVRLFWPAALACLPTLGFLVAGYLNKGGFTIGAYTPFSYAHAVGGVASLGMMTFGLDPTSFAQTVFALIGLPFLVVAAIVFCAPLDRKAVYVAMLVLPPVLALALNTPNTHVGRYFFASSPFLILLVADSFAALARRGAMARAIAFFVVAAALAGDGAALARLAKGEAEPWTQALAEIAASGALALASSDDFNVAKSVAWFNLAGGAALDLVPAERFCSDKPGWYILETRGGGDAPASATFGASECAREYRLVRIFNRDIPSQLPWALYRAESGG